MTLPNGYVHTSRCASRVDSFLPCNCIPGLPFEGADLEALEATQHAVDLRDEHYDNTRWDRD